MSPHTRGGIIAKTNYTLRGEKSHNANWAHRFALNSGRSYTLFSWYRITSSLPKVTKFSNRKHTLSERSILENLQF